MSVMISSHSFTACLAAAGKRFLTGLPQDAARRGRITKSMSGSKITALVGSALFG
jgi:hypothetical protein